MPFPCKCPRESRDKWIHVGIPVVERTWDNTCHQGLLNRRGFQAAYNGVAIPELLECPKQENHSGSETREILPCSCFRESPVKQRDVGFGNPNGFGRFDPRRIAGGLSLGSFMIKSPALLTDRPA
ncbi:hypothetical protein BFJ69_g2120 [Fusarium oxysporum]|uniref:Uncharacterized protein n=1 Tax=Fusarium oxysporum TaxID=5507 RepID=A0A420NVS8_FUSOX|nr:hypothetical protein BFJ69_g2120 [Fusarium oxysporum]